MVYHMFTIARKGEQADFISTSNDLDGAMQIARNRNLPGFLLMNSTSPKLRIFYTLIIHNNRRIYDPSFSFKNDWYC